MSLILLVDDSPVMLRLLEYILQSAGYGVQTALSGGAALASVAQQPPDLIFLDLMMPDMDGLEVLCALRSQAATATLPVVVISARAQEADRDAAFRAGATDYLTKPYGRDQVLAFAARYCAPPA